MMKDAHVFECRFKPELISKANGFFNLATVIATVLGMVIGNWLADATAPKGMSHWWLSAGVLIGVAMFGTLTSLSILSLPAGNPDRKFPWDAPVQTLRDLKTLGSNRPLLRVALGITFFYAVGALAQLNLSALGTSHQFDMTLGSHDAALTLRAGLDGAQIVRPYATLEDRVSGRAAITDGAGKVAVAIATDEASDTPAGATRLEVFEPDTSAYPFVPWTYSDTEFQQLGIWRH